ncbi:MAG: matrixin family metalloprotease [Deltaproteobacteria bacterium]|nr:MAG: matrixin family metalloprotease [Deltaproteobacteria bacterium]
MRSARLTPRLLALALGVALTLPAGAASAYTWYFVDGGDGPPLRWFRTEVGYHLAQVAPEELTLADVGPVVDAAFGTWLDLPGCAVPDVAYAGPSDVTGRTVPRTLYEEPDNVIVFVRSTDAWLDAGHARTWIAITSIAHDPTTGEIVDADIEVNDGVYRFSAGDGPPDESWIDLPSTMTHEIGHFFGMDHSDDVTATMYATYAENNDPLGGRTLAADDIDGVCALYTDVPPHVDATPASDCSGGGAAAGGPATLLAALAWVARRRRRSIRQSC